jgi:uncharacterized protein YutE (UPF0331/DUF86 family)
VDESTLSRLAAALGQEGVVSAVLDGGVVEGELAGRLGDAAGLRKLLVRGYAELDDLQVWQALAWLEDLRAFTAAAVVASER